MALQGSVRGRAPVLVDEYHILCVDQSGGMNIKVYDYKDKDYSQKCNLQVSRYIIKKIRKVSYLSFINYNYLAYKYAHTNY